MSDEVKKVEHTPEPWMVTEPGLQVGHVSSKEDGLGDIASTWGESAQEDARRIVACINALKGVTTEGLEEAVAMGITDVTTGNLFSSRLKLTRERDEARAMVEELVTKVQWLIEAIEDEGRGGTEEDRAVLIKAQTFLAAIHA